MWPATASRGTIKDQSLGVYDTHRSRIPTYKTRTLNLSPPLFTIWESTNSNTVLSSSREIQSCSECKFSSRKRRYVVLTPALSSLGEIANEICQYAGLVEMLFTTRAAAELFESPFVMVLVMREIGRCKLNLE